MHFDSQFYADSNETDLNDLIFRESQYLKTLLGVKISAFSFHNPVASHLNCDDEEYGGLINCYSKRFKEEVSYCSDSNGYWRFRRLHDVLSSATDKCLQVLTHPGWWQDKPMSPMERIDRCIQGRGMAIRDLYIQGLRAMGRKILVMTEIFSCEGVELMIKVKVFDVVEMLNNEYEFRGDHNASFTEIKPINTATKDSLVWIASGKNEKENIISVKRQRMLFFAIKVYLINPCRRKRLIYL